MTRNVRVPRSAPPRDLASLVLLLLYLATTTPSASAQTSIPFAPGVVLTYVMHNLDEPADQEGGEESGATKLAIGEAGGYEFEVGWLANPRRLDFELEMAKGETGAFDPQIQAGVDTKLLGLSIPMLGTKKELGTPWRLMETEPKEYNCGT